jgi:hypothetical protein
MKYKIFDLIICFVMLIGPISSRTLAQDYSSAIAAADTSSFSVNHNDGWELFNSYVAPYRADSVQLEIIVKHSSSIDWRQEHYVGKVKTAGLIPTAGQTLFFNLTVTNYSLRIDGTGKCYLRLVSGELPRGEPVIIPVKVFYRN